MPDGFDKLLAVLNKGAAQKPDNTAKSMLRGNEYVADGRVYSRPDGRAAGLLDNIVTRAVASLGRSVDNKSDNARWYRHAVLDRNTAPLTERDLSPASLSDLAIVANDALNRKSPSFGRKDYSRLFPNGTELSSTLGEANVARNPDGSAVVTDTYDFNYGDSGISDLLFGILSGEGVYRDRAYGAARWLGRRALPAGVRGVPVSIKLPRK